MHLVTSAAPPPTQPGDPDSAEVEVFPLLFSVKVRVSRRTLLQASTLSSLADLGIGVYVANHVCALPGVAVPADIFRFF